MNSPRHYFTWNNPRTLLVCALLLTSTVLFLPNPVLASTMDYDPNADGHELDWTPKGGGSHYVEVDDGNGTEDDDTTYISVTSGNQEDYWNLADTSESGTITNVRLSLRVKHDGGAGGEEFAFALANAADLEYVGSDVATDTTWTTYTEDHATNPIEATTWTWGQIDGLQLGIKSRAIGGYTGTGYCTSGWITVTYSVAVNDPPVISNKVTTDEGGHNITYSRSFTASDGDSDPMTWSLDDNTTSSFLGIEYKSDGTQSWVNGTPAWVDTEAYFWVNATVDDGQGGTDWCNYTLYINNTGPSITDKISVAEGTHNVTFSQSLSATDANSDNLDWSFDWTNASFLGMEQKTDGSQAWTNGTPQWSDRDQWFYVNVTVTDTIGSDWNNWTLFINNSAPSISNKITYDEERPNTAYSYDFDATDQNSDTLTWSLESNASFLLIGQDTGIVSGTTSWQNASYYVNATVSDTMDSDYCNYTLYVNNSIPQIVEKISADEGTHNVSFSRQFNSTDVDALDTHTWAIDWTNATFLSADSQNRTGWFNGTPTFSDTNQWFIVNVTVNDTYSEDYCNWTVYINNTAPTITNKIASDTGSVDVYYERDFDASDANSDTLEWGMTTNASFLSIDSATGLVNGTPTSEGVFWVNVTVTDSMDSDFSNYTLTISGEADNSSEGSNSGPLICDFSFNVDGHRVFFDGWCSRDDALIFHWIWDFGDGVVLYGDSSIEHVYSQAGSYNVSLEVIDYEGRTASVSKWITIQEDGPLSGFGAVCWIVGILIVIVILAAVFVAAGSQKKSEE